MGSLARQVLLLLLLLLLLLVLAVGLATAAPDGLTGGLAHVTETFRQQLLLLLWKSLVWHKSTWPPALTAAAAQSLFPAAAVVVFIP